MKYVAQIISSAGFYGLFIALTIVTGNAVWAVVGIAAVVTLLGLMYMLVALSAVLLLLAESVKRAKTSRR